MRLSSTNSGFTMIELLIVMAIMSLMALVAAPRISAFLGNERQESGLLSAYITAASDDALVSGRTNYLCITLAVPDDRSKELFREKTFSPNSISVYLLDEMKLVQNSHRILEKRIFSGSFALKAVYLEGSEAISRGDVIIPFYPDGSSENFTIEVSTGEKMIYFKKNKNSRNVIIADEI